MSRTSAESCAAAAIAAKRLAPCDWPMRLERTPGAQRGQQARRDLRIGRIERQHDLGEQVEPRAVRAVELRLVGA